MSSAFSQTLTFNQVLLSVDNSITVAAGQQLQRRVRNKLEQISVYPAIPPQVILVVRHLSDSEPGQLLASDPWRGRRAWEQATQNSLNNCWRKAVRPALSPVSTYTNSVWFADIAECLACLSRDLYYGVARDRWWWQTALGNQVQFSPRDKIFYHWLKEPKWLPATLTLLLTHRSTETGHMLDWLTREQSTRLLTAVAKEYSFSLLLTRETSSRDEISLAIAALYFHLPPLIQHQMERWSPVTQLLVAVCLTLPHTAQFIRVARSLADSSSPISEQSPPSPAGVVEYSPLPPASPDLTTAKNACKSTSVASSAATPVKSPEDATQPATPIQARTNLPTTSAPRTRITKNTTPKIVAMQSKSIVSELPPVNPTNDFPIPASETSITAKEPSVESAEFSLEPLIQESCSVIVPEPELGVTTAVGGLWYLVNVLIVLDWPGLDHNLTSWHQLSALAQALLPEVPLDPVWELLADLAGEPIAPDNLACWQALALTQVQAYLTDRLEHPEEIANYLLEPATLYLTRTHVDLVFTLDQIRLDLRLAGLDRDPGWVPELARVITFHYE